MKKILPLIAASIVVIAANSCGNSKLSQQEETNHRLDDSLKVALAQADTMYALLYDVTTGLEQISQLEHLLNSPINSENPDARADIKRQMEAIQRGLIERRHRIDELEKQLRGSKGENSKLRARITDLRKQIDAQAQTVRDLGDRLAAANIKIEILQDSIQEITASNDTLLAELDMRQDSIAQELQQAYVDLNTVYYVIGNKNELKDHGFKKGGNIFKKSKLGNEFDLTYMTKADRRTLTRIPLDSKKVEVMTDQPESSYALEKDENGLITLVILDPEKFWAQHDFLVIETK